MRLESLEVRGFRNLDLTAAFAPRLNAIVGPNGQGKTNLLEAIAVLAWGTSFRTHRHREWLRWGVREGRISGEVVRDGLRTTLEVRFTVREKVLRADGNAIRRRVDWFPHLRVVLFLPEDIHLVDGAPDLRRRFLDRALGSADVRYLYLLGRYNTIWKQRSVLRQRIAAGQADVQELEPWDDQLARVGAEIALRRREFLRELEPSTRRFYRELSGEGEGIFFAYASLAERHTTWEELVAVLAEELRRLRRESPLAPVPGPHRDDVKFYLGGREARLHASQGQKHSYALALAFGVAEWFASRFGEPPVLLLDDVVGPLDASRRAALAELLRRREWQVFLTATELAADFGTSDRLFRMWAGKLTSGEGGHAG
ncbi:DNA replication/repair protein RecF [Brockia lithotrophica]|uniref:DNA replication and repair protein RecF n=1 Tax=Brockia lithotrophica TaxID=933949 RepID=A0A660KWL1_9BACL|nr:DNA replication and repair protein RecF [Brockia lithotrophica]RKQ83912.1 DNA replication and repair protein RecF [Brockia lithotrophica]